MSLWTLKRDAGRSARFRQHVMGPWIAQETDHYAECINCGAQTHVNPVENATFGRAFNVVCPGKPS